MNQINTMLFAVLLSGATPTSVQADDAAKQSLLACANESDDARRLRCFDAAAATLRSAPEPAPASPVVTADDRFGARGDLKPDKLPELKEITATVTAVRAKPYGELVITLDNGQVWTEIASGSKIKIKAGDSVKIETGALNSFLLIANGRSSRVSRVR